MAAPRTPRALAAVLRDQLPAAFRAHVAAHLTLGARHRRGQIHVEVQAGDPGRVLVVCDDMPFLVDTMLMALEAAGHVVRSLAHPILAARRDRGGRLLALAASTSQPGAESWQQFELPGPVDGTQAAKLAVNLDWALRDVQAATRDEQAMRARVLAALREIQTHRPPLSAAVVAESCEFLRWMLAGNFTFLGSRNTALSRAGGRPGLAAEAGSELGLLDPSLPGTAARLQAAADARVRPQDLLREARSAQLLVITQSTMRSSVHRPGHLDYIGIKRFDRRGRVCGEWRILGLWTSSAWRQSPTTVPLLRLKIARIVARFALPPTSHDGRRLAHILETLPRDELLQAPATDLTRYARRILALYEHRQVLVLLRRERFHRFYSALVYLPRDRYDEPLGGRIAALLARTLRGTASLEDLALHDDDLVRLHLLVEVDPQARDRDIDIPRLERLIAEAAADWQDVLRQRVALLPPAERPPLLALASVTPADYRAAVSPRAAVADLAAALRALSLDRPQRRLEIDATDPPGQVHLRQAQRGGAAALSTLLPKLENFGLCALGERSYVLNTANGPVTLQDLTLTREGLGVRDVAARSADLLEALDAVLGGDAEDDGFNGLVLAAGLDVREVRVLRAACRHLLQTGLPFGQTAMQRALLAHPRCATLLFDLFAQRFDPRLPPRRAERRAGALQASLLRQLEGIASLDEDRMLRRLLEWILAVVRTNYFQHDGALSRGLAPAVAFKLDPARLPGLPAPVPRHEIFVHGTDVEGVHLRMSDVARGGLRWSDRAHDFRTEILGLMKAQHVKNALIVPAGAKGGFVPRRPLPTDPAQRQTAGIAAYRTFIGALLDVTDDLVHGHVRPPPRVRRHDGDDPYLVVAADKGTASFSDIANALALERGFWLGDAFASGGSAGYDHKAMGITARGAWECVRRHFRELRRDVDRDAVTVAGIGDMSGDVFGNGLLLSRRLRLVAAFDHRHVFLDPSPDAAASFRERARLFRLPRSSWADYDAALISAGGGVHARTAKSVAVTPQVRRLLAPHLDGVAQVTPVDLIRAILRMDVDLLWNGGIGTYVKSRDETHAAVGDRANDALRVDGAELRARVVGEGGNLGLTQRGRIEYALTGGRVNTDSIDNSAGVNTSDVEVNFKILLRGLPDARRNRLLQGATREVASLVLRNNVLQAQALSLMLRDAAAQPPDYLALARSLARGEGMDPQLEALPDEEALAERGKHGQAWTRPELAVLLSWQKIALNRALLASDVTTDPGFTSELERYFPLSLRRARPRALARHPLRNQIIATAIGNSLVNRMGAAFPLRMATATQASAPQVVRAYTLVRETLGLRELWRDIESQDGRATAEVQLRALGLTVDVAQRLCLWLLRHRRHDLGLAAGLRRYGRPLRELRRAPAGSLRGEAQTRVVALAGEFTAAGLPAPLALRIAHLTQLEPAFDLAELAQEHGLPVQQVASVHGRTGERLGLAWLREAIAALPAASTWQVDARDELHRATFELQRRLASQALASGAAAPTGAATLKAWDALLTQLKAAPQRDLAALSVAVEALRKL
jgi:glutamate dehydrogenase